MAMPRGATSIARGRPVLLSSIEPMWLVINACLQRLNGRDPQIRGLQEALHGFEVVPTDSTLVLDAHQLACRGHLSCLDALIDEAAIRHRCDVLFSEAFSYWRVIGGMQIRNPLLDCAGRGLLRSWSGTDLAAPRICGLSG